MRGLIWLVSLICVAAQLVPDQYGWSCYKIADSRKWPHCESTKGNSRKACLCGQSEFIKFTQNCLVTALANVTDVDKAMVKAQKSLCPGTLDAFLISESNNTDASKKDHKKVSLEWIEAQRVYSPPSGYEEIKPVGDEELQNALLSAGWRIHNDVTSEIYGVAILIYWFGAMFVIIVVHVGQLIITRPLQRLAQWKPCRIIRAYILYPPLFSQKHSQLVKKSWFVFSLPTRATTILIAMFAALNWSLLFTGFEYEPKNILFKTYTQQLNKFISIRSAYLVVYKLPLIILFAGRNNLLLNIVPWSLDNFNNLHKWIGRMTFFDLCVHAVSISLVKVEQGSYGWYWSVWYWRWGVAGITIVGLLVFHSMRLLVRHHYDFFVACHIALTVAFLIAAYYHVLVLPLGRKQIIAACAIWGFEHVARLTRIILAGCTVEARITHYEQISIVEAKNPKLWGEYYAGSGGNYSFVHFPFALSWWQSHPFTIVKEEEKLVMCILHKDGMTKKLLQIPEGPLNIAIDGPYGSRNPLFLFPQVVFIAGGVGITSILSYLRELQFNCSMEDNTEKPQQRLIVHWAVSDPAKIEWAARRLAVLKDVAEINIYMSDAKAITLPDAPYKGIDHHGRLSCAEAIAEACKEPDNKATAIFTCGPGTLNDDARKATCKAILKEPRYITYFEESFSW